MFKEEVDKFLFKDLKKRELGLYSYGQVAKECQIKFKTLKWLFKKKIFEKGEQFSKKTYRLYLTERERELITTTFRLARKEALENSDRRDSEGNYVYNLSYERVGQIYKQLKEKI